MLFFCCLILLLLLSFLMIANPVFATEFLECILQNTEEGTVLLKAIRDENNQIIDFEYILANVAAQKIINKSEDELIGNRMLEIFPDSKLSGLFDEYANVVETGKKYVKEIFYDFDGLELWLRINAFKFNNSILISFSDITDLKNAILESVRSRNLYSNLINYLPGVEMALLDRKYKIVIQEGNPFKALTESKEVEKNVNLHQILNKEEASILLPLLRSSFKGNSQRKEIEFGEELFRLNFVPIKEGKKTISHVLVISEDISIFRNSQNDLRNKIYALESANESLEQFAYVASHDLQEPLRKIRAFGDRLNTKYADQLEGSGRDYIERMQNAAARMQTLINDLLKYSRVGRFHEPFQLINLTDLIHDILNDLETTISETNASITVNDLPAVQAEPSQLRQLFQNLISNAIKFQQPDKPPEIVVTFEKINASEIEDYVIAEVSSVYYKIKITDNGIGFNEKYLDRIFNIFQRLHGRSEYKGTGIGLAICRKIVENHGGLISATSKPGQGSTFYVTLPEKQITEL